MAVSIDTVYQRVLAFANKEQRGYITPQEFNLFANQAQFEIFEQYFYDLNSLKKDNNYPGISVDDIIEEKLQLFEHTDGPNKINDPTVYIGAGSGGINKKVPPHIYRINRIEYNNKTCEILNTNEFNDARRLGPLVAPSHERPIANIRKDIIRVVGDNSDSITPTGIMYFKNPIKAQWGYVVINEKALYNSSDSVDFELHASEEIELVYKILKYAGLSMKRDDVAKGGQGLESLQIQQEKQ